MSGSQKTNDNYTNLGLPGHDESDVFAWLNRSLAPGPNSGNPPLSVAEMRSLALLMYQGRRDRDRFFDPALFSDPAWDILLAAYCLPEPGLPLSVTGLGHAAAAPHTTATRWIAHLCETDILSRIPSSTDGRVTSVSLTQKGRHQIEAYLNRFSCRLNQPDEVG